MPYYQGENFKKYLKDHGISVIPLAKKLGVSRNTVYQYYASENLTREVVTNIITNLKVKESDIWPDAEIEPTQTLDPKSKNIDTNQESMQRDLIEALKKIIDMKDAEIQRLTSVIQNTQARESANNVKGKSRASSGH